MTENIAESEIFAILPTGEKKKFHIALGKPYQVDTDEWACPLRIEGMYENLVDTHGDDSLQAITLALSLIQQLLGYFMEDGGKLYWNENGEEISLSGLLRHITSKIH